MKLQRFSTRGIAFSAAVLSFALLSAPAQQINNGRTSVSSSAQGAGAHLQRFTVKQEFAPVAQRSRRQNVSTVQPAGQSSNPHPARDAQKLADSRSGSASPLPPTGSQIRNSR
jgi:hypothetical protein